MIDLTLARISRLLQHTPRTWKAIHVAGTNGKGSICAYLTAMLHAGGVSCARFTSPHLVDRWDCITVNEKPVSAALFHEVERLVSQRNADASIAATEFELLAATAFEIFEREKIQVGVVEVGLGGRLDATNALHHKAVTVIAKIGLDHQSLLGNSLEEIALQKAGIMRLGVPCVVDDSNHPSVLKVIEEHARETKAQLVFPSLTPDIVETMRSQGFEPHQAQNLAVAQAAFGLACPEQDASFSRIIPIAKRVQWPGRLQLIDISKITDRQQAVLLDGAHNAQSAEVLAGYVDKRFRPQGKGITWVLAASEGKDLGEILGRLLRPEDHVAAVRFGPVDGMPWVKATDAQNILGMASQHGIDASCQYTGDRDLISALQWASASAGDGPLVVAGSLYLVSDMLRLLRDRE